VCSFFFTAVLLDDIVDVTAFGEATGDPTGDTAGDDPADLDDDLPGTNVDVEPTLLSPDFGGLDLGVAGFSLVSDLAGRFKEAIGGTWPAPLEIESRPPKPNPFPSYQSDSYGFRYIRTDSLIYRRYLTHYFSGKYFYFLSKVSSINYTIL